MRKPAVEAAKRPSSMRDSLHQAMGTMPPAAGPPAASPPPMGGGEMPLAAPTPMPRPRQAPPMGAPPGGNPAQLAIHHLLNQVRR